MLRETLNKAFVLDQLQSALTTIKVRSSSRRDPKAIGPHEPDLPPEMYKVAAKHVTELLASELKAAKKSASGAQSTGEGQPQIEDTCFISSDPIVSITQSALDYYFEQRGDKVVPKDNPADDIGEHVTSRTLDLPATAVKKRRLFDKFSVTDPGWVSSLIAMGISQFEDKHAFNRRPAPPFEMADRCRLVMAGDWGSGLPRAQKVARQMRKVMLEGSAAGMECHVIHLGDVYYSGWEFEYRNRFLDHWPVRSGEHQVAKSWSLNGNHDMYAGGHGYYDTLLADNRFSAQAKSSFFRLFNKHWQFVGLDTSYEDNGLVHPQASWLADVARETARKTIVLTHHQFYSTYENSPAVGAVLRKKLKQVLSEGRIYGAIWGHEHRCIIHEPHDQIQFGRLVGHGGVPVYMTHRPGDPYVKPVIFEDRRSTAKLLGLEQWAYMGFAVFDLDGPTLTARYIDENGKQQYDEVVLAEAA